MGTGCAQSVVWDSISALFILVTSKNAQNTFKIILWMIGYLIVFLGTFSTKWKNSTTLLVILGILLSINLLALGLGALPL